jgi:signal peptidase I
MFPTLKNLQEVEIIAISSDESINRGDIVVFSLDTDPVKTADKKLWHVKRVIGLPGEQVIFRNGSVWIKNSVGEEFQLDEPYLQNDSSYKLGIRNYTENGKGNVDYFEPVLDHNQFYVLGDNRTGSSDSRNFGAVDAGLIKFRVVG